MNAVKPEVWRLWVRTYGLAGARRLCATSGMAPPDKGDANGTCNRTACSNTPANWWSSVDQAHYCEGCAREINRWVDEGVAKLERVT